MTDEDITGQQRIIYLITGYIAGRLTVEETAELESWIAEEPKNRQLFEKLTDEAYRQPILSQWKPQAAENSLQNLKHKISRQKTRALWPRIAAAASILLFLSVGSYYIFHKQPVQQVAVIKPGTFKNDVDPGKTGAILTLGNGKQIVLKNAKQGLLASQGNTQIQKTTTGQLEYNTRETEVANTEVTYNTVTTKRANKIAVTLPDGTIAYLDAASSIHFPTAFNGNSREVTITGQVYFEVTHDPNKPFRVTANKEKVEVLGTHFNISAYDDEAAVKTTLLEGSVKITSNGQSALLHPGEQAEIGAANKINIIHPDLDEVMAWKNGLFKFNNTDLPTTMRQLTRWYDVDVVYQGPDKAYHFGGYIPRDSKLSEALRILQLSGVKFSIDGKKIIVYQ